MKINVKRKSPRGSYKAPAIAGPRAVPSDINVKLKACVTGTLSLSIPGIEYGMVNVIGKKPHNIPPSIDMTTRRGIESVQRRSKNLQGNRMPDI